MICYPWRYFFSLLFLFPSFILTIQGSERFIFYDINPGEGFNLRRDVFMRMAVLVRKLNRESHHNFVLVLPPWNRLYHWQSPSAGQQTRIPWRDFFDVESISRFTPVLDLDDYLAKETPIIDRVYYLQPYKEAWKEGRFEEKFNFQECNDQPHYYRRRTEDGKWKGHFWNYDNIVANHFGCLSVQGSASVLKSLILDTAKEEKAIMVDRAEQLLHDWFGDETYWEARRSMRFADHLVRIANDYRRQHLDSNDKSDDTVMNKRWEDQRPERSVSRGGPYMCVHLRRKDFVHARSGQVPSIQGAAEQVREKLERHGLKKVFVSSDTPDDEFRQLEVAVGPEFEVCRFVPSSEQIVAFKDGGVAIIDQSICSHSKYFLGTAESTFTFRIQEEREIMGFPVSSTFGMLCPDGKANCERGSVWKIVYPVEELRETGNDKVQIERPHLGDHDEL